VPEARPDALSRKFEVLADVRQVGTELKTFYLLSFTRNCGAHIRRNRVVVLDPVLEMPAVLKEQIQVVEIRTAPPARLLDFPEGSG
jgi:hypothetical protein